MAQTDIESAFRLIPVHSDNWELLHGHVMEWVLLLRQSAPLRAPFSTNIYLASSLMPLSGYFKTTLTVRSPFCHILDDYHIVDLLLSLCLPSLSVRQAYLACLDLQNP